MTLATSIMRRIRTFSVLVSFGAAMCVGQLVSAEARDDIRGSWRFESIYPTPNVQGPSPSQQQMLLTSKIVIGANSITACGQTTEITSTEVRGVSASEFLANNLVSLASVGIQKPKVVEVILNKRQSGTCFGAFPMPGQDIYVKSKHELVISFEGVFYRAVRDEQPHNDRGR